MSNPDHNWQPQSKPKIIQLLLTPNDANWQGMLLGLADNGDTYRMDHTDGWVLWFDGIAQKKHNQPPQP